MLKDTLVFSLFDLKDLNILNSILENDNIENFYKVGGVKQNLDLIHETLDNNPTMDEKAVIVKAATLLQDSSLNEKVNSKLNLPERTRRI